MEFVIMELANVIKDFLNRIAQNRALKIVLRMDFVTMENALVKLGFQAKIAL